MSQELNKTIPIYTVQNADRIITRKDFQREELKGRLLVTSIFVTHQGEGTYQGWPAVFVRLAGCNYGDKVSNCLFCDTSFHYDRATAYTYAELTEYIRRLVGNRQTQQQRYVLVITGGEPTLQENLIEFISYVYPEDFLNIQIETNGTQAYFFEKLDASEVAEDVFVCVSPKASYKAGRYAKLSDTVLHRADELKFVLEADPNSPHYEVPDWALDHSNHKARVTVSPMAVYARPYQGEVSSIWDEGLIDKQRTAANYAYAAEYARKHHLHISTQQHLALGVA